MGVPNPQHNTDPGKPLEHLTRLANPRHEQFAQAYAGEAHGNAAEAYRLAGYGPKDAKVAGNCGLRLLENEGIRERVKTLRAAIEDHLQIDRLWLAQQRKAIALDPTATATAGERLAALRDIEKSMGWLAPDIITMNHAAVIEHRWTLEDIRVEHDRPAQRVDRHRD